MKEARSQKPEARSQRRSLTSGFWLLASGLFVGCPAQTPVAPQAGPIAVKTVKLEKHEISREIVLPVELWAWQKVSIVAKVTGYVEKVPVDRGSVVAAGDLLATVRVPELEDERRKRAADVNVAAAEVASARADLELQAATSKRYTQLVLDRAASVQEADEARARETVARARIDQAEAKLASARESLASTETWLAYATIAAPFSGTVTERLVHPGAFVSAAERTPLFEVVDRSTLRGVVDVPESDAPHVKVGVTSVRVVIPEVGARPGVVSRAAAALDPKTRTLRIEVDLPNDGALLPGMYGHAALVLERHETALVLPRAAVSGGAVFVVTGGKVAKRVVTLGLDDAKSVEILGGIEAADAVASRALGLQDGALVTATEEAR
jgi:RND family efflux transporter MFP subunit